ncbi:MAG: polyprenyl synthetase family protein [Pseudomonadales bacterium]|nr:polyprenyl synthetase family protein [Pseudomonadales bacterium]
MITDLSVDLIAIEDFLQHALPPQPSLAPHLLDAMRYVIDGQGKRIRPALVVATATSLGADRDIALAPAAAIEFLHSYSLVHDDLPAMDDDALRRGRPTCHLAFDEATAILVGDALQALAFELITSAPKLNEASRLHMTSLLADAAGWRNMVGGQALDIKATGNNNLDIQTLSNLHEAKTGALFRTSVQFGCIAAGHRDDDSFSSLSRFGERIGLAYQITDDILDVIGKTDVLGKSAGADTRQEKTTYPALIGLDESRHTVVDLHRESMEILSHLDLNESPLASLVKNIVDRSH